MICFLPFPFCSLEGKEIKKEKKELRERCTAPLRILNMLMKFCPATPHVCPGGSVRVCVCVLTAANFSYMSIFLHIRSHTHTHTGKNSLKFCLATKMFLAYAVAHLWPPGAGFSNFWLLDLNDEHCHKGPCMLASSHTHTHTNTRVLPLLRKTMSRKHSSIDP